MPIPPQPKENRVVSDIQLMGSELHLWNPERVIPMPMNRTTAICGAVLILTAAAAGQSSKMPDDLRNRQLAPGSMIDVIVQFREGSTEANHQKVLERGAQLKRH